MPEKKKPQPRVQLRPGSLASLGGLLAQQLPPDPGVGWVGPERPAETWGEVSADPLSALFDFGRGAVTGDAPTGMNLQGLGALLAAALPLASGAKAFRAATTAEDAAVGIKAYHGSPHDFDKFSLSKIGTGEGAQVYGHGLYFAEKPGVAAYYKQAGVIDPRDAMTQIIDSARTYNGDDMQLRGVIKSGLYRNPALSRFGDSDAIVNDLVQVVRGHEAGGTISPAAMSALQRVDRAMGELPKGRMYEVSINADPEQLLDWDKPLSQQPPAVRRALEESDAAKRLTQQDADARAAFGDDYADDWRTGFKAGDVVREMGDPKRTAQTLRESGIPGTKYLDSGSRAAGEGSRNYVIFDDSLVSILKKYGVALPVIEGLRRKASANGGRLDRNDVEGLF